MSVHYTYVLLSQEDNRLYTGCTHNLEKRSTSRRVRNRDDAFRRERFLETSNGKRFLKNRLSTHLESISWNKLERH